MYLRENKIRQLHVYSASVKSDDKLIAYTVTKKLFRVPICLMLNCVTEFTIQTGSLEGTQEP